MREGWKVQSSAQVKATGDKVSQPGFPTQAWYSTSAPKTVFAVLVENGVYKNPYYGMNLRAFPGVEYKIGTQFANQDMPANSPYAVPWWYRKEFDLPASDAGKQIWIEFRGINYRADIWINGKKVAGSEVVVGAFRRYDFNVTQFVRPGEKNAVAVAVSAPTANELGITWVDWNPSPPDKDMGLWQEVVISTSGPVALRHPVVEDNSPYGNNQTSIRLGSHRGPSDLRSCSRGAGSTRRDTAATASHRDLRSPTAYLLRRCQ